VDAVAMKSALLSAPRHLGGMRMSVAHPNKKKFIGGNYGCFGLVWKKGPQRAELAQHESEVEVQRKKPPTATRKKNRKKGCMNFVGRAFYMVGGSVS
jgi:hypothetical protein